MFQFLKKEENLGDVCLQESRNEIIFSFDVWRSPKSSCFFLFNWKEENILCKDNSKQISYFFQEIFTSFWGGVPLVRNFRIKSSTEQGPDSVDASAVFCRLLRALQPLWAADCLFADQRFRQPSPQSRHVLVKACWLYATDCSHHSGTSH